MEYKPLKPFLGWLYELYIAFSLRVSGHDSDFAQAVIGYKPEDVPFIYSSESKVVNSWTLKSELWMGTTVKKEDLIGVWDDQIPEVVVQWWGNTPIKDGVLGIRKITRLEVHHFGNGCFVSHEYNDVSDMGSFDGKLVTLRLYKPKSGFMHSGKHRKEFSIHTIHKMRLWGKVNIYFSNLSGTTMLNAWSQMKEFRTEITLVKP